MEQSRKGVATSPTPLCGSYWKGSLRVVNFSYYSLISGRRIVGCIPFPRISALYENTVTSRIWTWFPMSIFYDSSHNTISAFSLCLYIYIYIYIISLFCITLYCSFFFSSIWCSPLFFFPWSIFRLFKGFWLTDAAAFLAQGFCVTFNHHRRIR